MPKSSKTLNVYERKYAFYCRKTDEQKSFKTRSLYEKGLKLHCRFCDMCVPSPIKQNESMPTYYNMLNDKEISMDKIKSNIKVEKNMTFVGTIKDLHN